MEFTTNSVGLVDIIEYAKNVMGYKHQEARVLITKELVHLTDSVFSGKAIIYDVSIAKVQATEILKEFTDFCGLTEDFKIIITLH